MKDKPDDPQNGNQEQIHDLVRLFEGFSRASSEFSKNYHSLEERVAEFARRIEKLPDTSDSNTHLLHSILSSVPVGMLIIDLDGKITHFNRMAEELTGIESNRILGRPYESVLHSSRLQPDSALYTLATGSLIDSRERMLALNGSEPVPVRFWTAWLHDRYGEAYGVLEVFEDLRPFRRLQKQMEHNSTLASMGEMAAQVAHELRNPLAGVQGFAQFLLEDLPEDHPGRTNAEKIIQGVREIEHIAGHLLEFTRPVCLNNEKVDLQDLLNHEADLIRAEISSLNRDVIVQLILPDENIPVECDPHLVKQAILNLLKNALHAIAGDGEIQIQLIWDLFRNRVFIDVRDDGCGIPEDLHQKIFNPFFTTRNRGNGLGLAMVRKIIHAHSGDIHLKSSKGKGSTFRIELPIARFE